LRILVDLDVILDVLMAREPHYAASAEVWARVEVGEVDGCVAAHSVSTLYYLYARRYSRREASEAIASLLKVFAVATVDQAVIERGLQIECPDFEDALQVAVAEREGVSYLVTRDMRHLRATSVPTIHPADLAALLRTRLPGE
jgi:predicted nucleic acid-binding protein